jgi:transcriptional regulator with XRE-family HTH domain
MRSMGEILADRIRTVRKMRALTQAELAERLRDLGDESAEQAQISRIEKPNGTAAQNLSIHRLLLIASALNVAPVHLLAPDDIPQSTDPDTGEVRYFEPGDPGPSAAAKQRRIYLHRRTKLNGVELRAWIKGERPLPGADPREYFSAIPWGEFQEMVDRDNPDDWTSDERLDPQTRQDLDRIFRRPGRP